ncbi:MAG: hypothetical protein OXC09_00530 [Truepera sp.]|nr:hypothetical protein [Truepera sp.]
MDNGCCDHLIGANAALLYICATLIKSLPDKGASLISAYEESMPSTLAAMLRIDVDDAKQFNGMRETMADLLELLQTPRLTPHDLN